MKQLKLIALIVVFVAGSLALPSLPRSISSARSAEADRGCDWPSFGRTPDNNRVAPDECGPTMDRPVKLWQLKTPNIVEASPVIYANKVYCGSSDAMLCLDLDTGNIIWKFDTPLSSWTPTVWENKVFFGSNYVVYCVDALSGLLLWQFRTNKYIQSAPAIFNGFVYIGSEDNHLYCLDAITGEMLWKFKTEKSVVSNPLVMNDKLYFNSENTLYCMDTKSCDIVWKKIISVHLFNSPVYSDNRIFFGSLEGYLYCMEATKGSLLWKIEVGEGVTGTPVIWNDCVYFGSTDGLFFCADTQAGLIKWSYSSGGYLASPAICGNKVYFGSIDKYFYCLDAKNGNFLWAYRTSHAVCSSPAISNKKIVFASYDNSIYCFGEGTDLPDRDVPKKIDIFAGFGNTFQPSVDICSTQKIQAHVLNAYNEVLGGYQFKWSIDPGYATISNDVITPLKLGVVQLQCQTADMFASQTINIEVDNQPIDYLFFDVTPGVRTTEILHLYNQRNDKINIVLSSSSRDISVQPESVEIDPHKGVNIDVSFMGNEKIMKDNVQTIQLEYYLNNQKFGCDKKILCFISVE